MKNGPAASELRRDAHDCIMVPIPMDRPNTRMRAIFAPEGKLRLGIVVVCTHCRKAHPTNVACRRARDRQGKSLRDGLRPPLTGTARGGQRKPDRGEEMITTRSNEEMKMIGKSLRDGLRPALTGTARGGQRKSDRGEEMITTRSNEEMKMIEDQP